LTMDSDSMKLWSLAMELTEKLSNNRALLSNLRKQTEELKANALEIGTSYRVRRYNIDLSKQVFESELERNNAALVLENHALLYENRQLDSLLKEYEQSLQMVMAKVRHHSQVTAQHEGVLQKHYESLIASQEAEHKSVENSPGDDNFQHSLLRLKHLIKLAVHSQRQSGQEDETDNASISPLGSTSLEESLIKLGVNPDQPDSISEIGSADEHRQDWVDEREIEISRLQKENADIREALGIAPGGVGYTDHERAEYGQGRSIFGEENAGTLKRQMHAKRDSIISSPGHQFGHGMIPMRGYREASPPDQLQPPPVPPPNQHNNGLKQTLSLEPIRKPPPLRSLSSIRPSSPLGLYRNISLPSTSTGGDISRK